MRAPQRQPLLFRQQPPVAAFGVGGEWRFFRDEAATVIAIDAGGREIGDPMELFRARGEIAQVLARTGSPVDPGGAETTTCVTSSKTSLCNVAVPSKRKNL